MFHLFIFAILQATGQNMLRWRAPEELLEYFSVTYPELPPSEVFQELDTTGSEVTLLLSWRYTSKGLKEGDSADRKTFILHDFPLGKRIFNLYKRSWNLILWKR